MCKRLNPNLEVPEVIDLIKQIELMLQSDETQRTMFFKESDKGEVSVNICKINLSVENNTVYFNPTSLIGVNRT